MTQEVPGQMDAQQGQTTDRPHQQGSGESSPKQADSSMSAKKNGPTPEKRPAIRDWASI